MAQESRSTIKGYFNTGDTPTEAQYHNFIDSAKWYDEGDAAQSRSFSFAPPGPSDINPQGRVGFYDVDPLVSWTAGLLTVNFVGGSVPAFFYMKGDVSAMNNGDLTIRFDSVDNLNIKATSLVLKKADSTNQLILNPEQFVTIAENVTAGQTNIVFSNLNNVNRFDIAMQLAAW